MNTVRQIKTLLIMLALIMGAANGAWALSTADIKIDESITHGSVTVKSVVDATRTVTITVTPASGYFVERENIVVQKLQDPGQAQARRMTPGIADNLTVSGPANSSEEADYTFVVPEGYASALVTVTFTGMNPATATVTPNSLTYTGEPQELVTLGTVVGGAATDPVTYSLNGGAYSSTIPTATDAGTYTVNYKVAGDATHAEGSGSVSVTINKAKITSVVLANNAISYDENSHTVGVSSVKAGTINVPSTDYDISGNTATVIGTYTVTVTAKPESTNFTGSATATFRIVEETIIIINSSTSADDVTALGAHYLLMSNISASVLANLYSTTSDFTGTLEGGYNNDGNFYKINMSGYSHALFNTINGGTVKNVVLDNVTINSGTNVGAICNEATGASRIYNCGVLATGSTIATDDDGYTKITSCTSTISGSGFVGGIVGLLDGSSRVINCFSYAEIKNGSEVGGIVGHNNVATTSAADNQKTMVMNCMFYGDITGGSSKAPIYNGQIITNRSDQSGVSNFNYFWAGASYVQEQDIDVYNCALSAETRFLQRFEFFRHLLNSNRELAAWWATGDRNKKNEIAKWVMEPSQIGSTTPYPILKTFDKYPSVVNFDADHAEPFSSNAEIKKTQYNQGRKFSTTFTVNIQMGTSGDGYHPPVDAQITKTSVTRNITDKDPTHFNFNYYKIQLPYYNDVGTNNYRKDANGTSRVVTGWKIVNMSKSAGSFTTGSDAAATVNSNGDITLTATPYNFADRNCTAKDIYSNDNKRVFSQGAYLDVPEGVTSITIEPYWAKCVYVSDQYPDIVYNQDMSSANNVTTVGGGVRYTNGQSYSINDEDQVVYTTMGNAAGQMPTSGTVYDNAIVLVGNVHSSSVSNTSNTKSYSIMSIDLDKDNEPDYSYILRFNSRVRVHPVRVDFLNIIGLGMAQKSHEGQGTYNFGIMQPYGWFESTNTSLFRVTQLEYDLSGRENSPMILQGGVIEQWVTVGGKETSIVSADAVSYYHVGSNVWFKEFHIGVHQDKYQNQFFSPHPPISVTGGDYNIFYLTGYYNSPNNNYPDNAECYINGGRFNKVAGTGMQGLGKPGGADNTGNIIWQIDNADIDEFYAGGMNAAHIAEGNITTVISNSRVDQFCGGPKFGDMNSDKIVVTNATNCTFRTFFGAGYGGNSYNRRYPKNQNNKININWDSWVQNGGTFEGEYFEGYKNVYLSDYGGVGSRIDYQFIPMSNNTQNVCRLFVDYVSFSLATTYDVTSKLTDCTITKDPLGRLDLSFGLGNFYGGGSLGKVDGPVKSILTNCTVEGNVFGAGYSATLPSVMVMGNSFQTQPHYDENLGAYLEAELPATVTYNWQHRNESIADAADDETRTTLAIDKTNHILYTNENLDKSNLGSVAGNVTLTIKGNSMIGTEGDTTKGNVFGGGEQSYVTGAGNKVTVNIEGNTEVYGNVYGGGDQGAVEGSTKVNIQTGD